MIAAREAGGCIHSLLNHGPFTACGHYERMEIDLESVGDAVIVDLCRQTAGTDERVAVETLPVGDRTQFVRGPARLFPAAAADIQAQLRRAGGETALESTHHRSGYAG